MVSAELTKLTKVDYGSWTVKK